MYREWIVISGFHCTGDVQVTETERIVSDVRVFLQVLETIFTISRNVSRPFEHLRSIATRNDPSRSENLYSDSFVSSQSISHKLNLLTCNFKEKPNPLACNSKEKLNLLVHNSQEI